MSDLSTWRPRLEVLEEGVRISDQNGEWLATKARYVTPSGDTDVIDVDQSVVDALGVDAALRRKEDQILRAWRESKERPG